MAELIKPKAYDAEVTQRLMQCVHYLTKPNVNLIATITVSASSPSPIKDGDGYWSHDGATETELTIEGVTSYNEDCFADSSLGKIDACIQIMQFVKEISEGKIHVRNLCITAVNDQTLNPQDFKLHIIADVKKAGMSYYNA